MAAPIAILFDRLGPYHAARIEAAARRYPTVAVEFFGDSSTYAWDRVESAGRFERRTIAANATSDQRERLRFALRLYDALSQLAPRVIAIPGWHHYGSLIALSWALRERVPAVVMSASQLHDAPRLWWKEGVKSRVIRLCSAALVGGQRQLEYIRRLGMPRERSFPGYDVVDNEYFADGAAQARARASELRSELGLPARYMFSSSRFVAKKNVIGLLRAYDLYRRRAGADAVHLVLAGDGPSREEIERARKDLGLTQWVHLPGFLQYWQLPAYYGLAESFVLASTIEQWGLVVNEAMASGLPVIISRRCGCVPDLVHDGANGFVFDPGDQSALVPLLERMANDHDMRARMAERSRELVRGLSPQVFAEHLHEAATVALSTDPPVPSMADWLLLAALTLR